jgi:hypothetical protein
MDTGSPVSSSVLGSGLCRMTRPASTVSLLACVTSPTVSPAAVMAASARSWVKPVTSGTATRSPPPPNSELPTRAAMTKTASTARPSSA